MKQVRQEHLEEALHATPIEGEDTFVFVNESNGQYNNKIVKFTYFFSRFVLIYINQQLDLVFLKERRQL